MPVLNVTLSICMMLLHGEFTNIIFAIQNQCYYNPGIFFTLYNIFVDLGLSNVEARILYLASLPGFERGILFNMKMCSVVLVFIQYVLRL